MHRLFDMLYERVRRDLRKNVRKVLGMRALNRLFAVLTAVGALAAMPTASAHHSFATHYDSDIIVELSGVLSEVDLRSPHSLESDIATRSTLNAAPRGD